MVLGLIGISMPVYWLGEVMNLITQSRFHDTWLFSWVPPLGYKHVLRGSQGLVPDPGHSVDHAVDPLHRPLWPRAARQPRRGAAGGLHPHRARQGPVAKPASCCATRCAPRSSPSSPCSASISARWSAASALLTEVVFGLQGVGKLTYDALQNLDLPVIMTTVLYASFFVVMANALVDILYMPCSTRA